jgi:hypothetical protein
MPKKKSNLPWDMLFLAFGLPAIAFIAWLTGSIGLMIFNYFHHR